MGGKAAAFRLDTGDLRAFDAFVADVRKTLENWGRERFDYLVNNAGNSQHIDFDRVTEADFDAVVNVHFKGVYFLTQKLLPLMNDGGRIVNISSGLTRVSVPGSSAYAAAKGAIEVLTRYLAKELGPRRITANVVAPGPVQTDFSGGKESVMQSQEEHVALITGANKGIGFEIARQLGKARHLVLLGARDASLGEAAASTLKAESIDVHFIHIDLSKPATIQAAAATIEADWGRLDVLVNNAGIADRADGPPSKTSIDAVRRIFDTNFFGTLAVTQAVLPLLRHSSSGRIVNVSSGLGSLAHNGDPSWEFSQAKFLGYNSSKAALNMLTVQLAAELRDSGIKVNSADPGFTATDLNAHRGRQTTREGAAAAVRLALLPDDGPTGGFFSASNPEPW
jgi:NAD(P)-dependent dehydrogenase (short-subunit alcohol dehydrogenase family)